MNSVVQQEHTRGIVDVLTEPVDTSTLRILKEMPYADDGGNFARISTEGYFRYAIMSDLTILI